MVEQDTRSSTNDVDANIWTPLSVHRNQRQPFQPIDGVPSFIRPPVLQWINNAVGPDAYVAMGLRLDLRIESIDTSFDPSIVRAGDIVEAGLLHEPPFVILDVVDWLLGHGCDDGKVLEHILRRSGHILRVSPEASCLVERIDPTAWKAYEQVTSSDDTASQLMREAWELAFGRDPSLGDAWGRAIKSIETLLKPIVSPNDDKATLGKMVSALRSSPEKWDCALPDRSYKANGEDKTRKGIDYLIDTLATIGYQPDRHGGGDEQNADETTARGVIMLSTTVLGWLRDGVLFRTGRDTEKR